MKRLIAIVASEPNSINSEIIAKAWKGMKDKKNLLIIGNFSILRKQIKKINIKIKLSKIDSIDKFKNNKTLNILDVPYKFKHIFKNNLKDIQNYVLKSLQTAHDLAFSKKIKGFINAPVNKAIFNNKQIGVTEYLAKKNNVKNKEVMMIYNKSLSVVPLTTHVEIRNITKKITPILIRGKILTLNKCYNKLFKKKPKLVVLGLKPHNRENRLDSIENKIITPTIKKLRKIGLDIKGPFPADTIFNNQKKIDYNVIVGMYHDQVLAPFKALYGYDAINITLGLKYLRISPDHGIASDLIGRNKANPESLIAAINFLKKN